MSIGIGSKTTVMNETDFALALNSNEKIEIQLGTDIYLTKTIEISNKEAVKINVGCFSIFKTPTFLGNIALSFSNCKNVELPYGNFNETLNLQLNFVDGKVKFPSNNSGSSDYISIKTEEDLRKELHNVVSSNKKLIIDSNLTITQNIQLLANTSNLIINFNNKDITLAFDGYMLACVGLSYSQFFNGNFLNDDTSWNTDIRTGKRSFFFLRQGNNNKIFNNRFVLLKGDTVIKADGNNSAGNYDYGLKVFDNYFVRCVCALAFVKSYEYSEFKNNKVFQCAYGVLDNSGNNLINENQFVGTVCEYFGTSAGIYLDNTLYTSRNILHNMFCNNQCNHGLNGLPTGGQYYKDTELKVRVGSSDFWWYPYGTYFFASNVMTPIMTGNVYWYSAIAFDQPTFTGNIPLNNQYGFSSLSIRKADTLKLKVLLNNTNLTSTIMCGGIDFTNSSSITRDYLTYIPFGSRVDAIVNSNSLSLSLPVDISTDSPIDLTKSITITITGGKTITGNLISGSNYYQFSSSTDLTTGYYSITRIEYTNKTGTVVAITNSAQLNILNGRPMRVK